MVIWVVEFSNGDTKTITFLYEYCCRLTKFWYFVKRKNGDVLKNRKIRFLILSFEAYKFAKSLKMESIWIFSIEEHFSLVTISIWFYIEKVYLVKMGPNFVGSPFFHFTKYPFTTSTFMQKTYHIHIPHLKTPYPKDSLG